jgi:hypothetical protein
MLLDPKALDRKRLDRKALELTRHARQTERVHAVRIRRNKVRLLLRSRRVRIGRRPRTRNRVRKRSVRRRSRSGLNVRTVHRMRRLRLLQRT